MSDHPDWSELPELDEPTTGWLSWHVAERLRLAGRVVNWVASTPPGGRLRLAPGDKLSEHFTAREFACKGTGRLPPGGIPQALIDILEDVRTHFGAPVRITSGYRSPSHNRRVGGARRSQHLRGTAADIQVDGVPARKVHAYLSRVRGRRGGLGGYRTFTHVDVGPDGRRW